MRHISTFNKFLFTFLLIAFFNLEKTGFSQNQSPSDSMTLSQIITQVIQTHPSIKEAEEAINMADAGIGLARSGYFPTIGISAKYTRLWPLVSIPFGGETFSLYPANNYDAELDYNQVIYDFGKTSRNVAYGKANRELAQQSLEQWKQKLTIMTLNSFYMLEFLQEAIKINEEELDRMQKHLAFTEEKEKTGTATQYEVLQTKVNISNLQSQRIDLETQIKNQTTLLNSLLGESPNSSRKVKTELSYEYTLLPEDSLISIALTNRDEMKLAQDQSNLANINLSIEKGRNNPSIYIFAAGGEKNGYIPDLNALKLNYAAGMGLQIPIFDGSRKKNNVKIANSKVQNSNYEIELTRRSIINDVMQNENYIASSKQKVDQLKLQLSEDEEALSLAETKYKAGVITNLDLLDATKSVSASRLKLLQAQIDYVISIYKLRLSLGERLY